MTFLFDENLSPDLVSILAETYPECVHVRDVGLARADDLVVWQYAITRGLGIVSKDSDFHQLSFVLGPPPKVIWVRLGNCSTQQVANLLRSRHAEIADFLADPRTAFLVLS